VDEQHPHQSDDERLVRRTLLAAFPPIRSSFSERRGEQIIRAAALERRDRRALVGSRIAACVAASFTLVAGTAGAASAALPGQPLYPLKRIVERAMIAVTSDKDDAARLQLQFAERRLKEAHAVGTEEPAATSLVEKFNEHINAAASLAGPEVSEEIADLQRSRDESRGGGDGGPTVSPQSERSASSASASPSTGPSPTASPSPTPSASPSASPSPSPSPSGQLPTSEPSPSETPSGLLDDIPLLDDLPLLPHSANDDA
jgi:hypothetical protein